MFTLTVLVFVTSLQRPDEHVGYRYVQQYETRFTCLKGQEQLQRNADLAHKLIEHGLKYERRHITLRRSEVSCTPSTPHI